MPGVHGLQHVERLRAADLADQDPVGSHAQGVAHQIPDRDRGEPLDAGRPRLQAHDVRGLEVQLGGVLDGDDPLAGRGCAPPGCSGRWSCRPRSRRSPRCSPRTAPSSAAAPPPAAGRSPRSRRSQARNRRITRYGPSTATGGMTTFTREPSGSRASTSGDVRSARRPRGATTLSTSWRSVASPTATAVRRSSPALLHPDGAGAVDHDLVHRVVGHEGLQRPQAREPGRHALRQPFLEFGAEQRRPLAHKLADLLEPGRLARQAGLHDEVVQVPLDGRQRFVTAGDPRLGARGRVHAPERDAHAGVACARARSSAAGTLVASRARIHGSGHRRVHVDAEHHRRPHHVLHVAGRQRPARPRRAAPRRSAAAAPGPPGATTGSRPASPARTGRHPPRSGGARRCRRAARRPRSPRPPRRRPATGSRRRPPPSGARRPVPAPSPRARSVRWSGPAPRCSRYSPAATSRSRRRRASICTSSPTFNQSATPGVAGSGTPSSPAVSPQRSTSRAPASVSAAQRRAARAATTDVPEPPLTDQQATYISRLPFPGAPRGAPVDSSAGEAGNERRPMRRGEWSGPPAAGLESQKVRLREPSWQPRPREPRPTRRGRTSSLHRSIRPQSPITSPRPENHGGGRE